MPTSQIYQSEPVVLTDAQVKALPTTGIQIVPAPGAGKALSFVAGLAVAHKVAGYTNVDQYANIIYLQNPTGSLFFAMGEWSNVFLENAEDRYMPFAQYATPRWQQSAPRPVNREHVARSGRKPANAPEAR